MEVAIHYQNTVSSIKAGKGIRRKKKQKKEDEEAEEEAEIEEEGGLIFIYISYLRFNLAGRPVSMMGWDTLMGGKDPATTSFEHAKAEAKELPKGSPFFTRQHLIIYEGQYLV
ncbi:hypothetical protein QOT17_014420 [Balamuthia mandrillaris]